MQTVPKIVSYGRAFIGEYGINEFEDSLRRAFTCADFIPLDSNPRRQKFLSACVAWAMGCGILIHDTSVDDEQSEVSIFRLTAFGKRHLFPETVSQ